MKPITAPREFVLCITFTPSWKSRDSFFVCLSLFIHYKELHYKIMDRVSFQQEIPSCTILYQKETILLWLCQSKAHTAAEEILNKSTCLKKKKWKLPVVIGWQIFLLGNNTFLRFPEGLNTKHKKRDGDEIQKNYLCVFCWNRINKWAICNPGTQALFGQLYCPFKGAAW